MQLVWLRQIATESWGGGRDFFIDHILHQFLHLCCTLLWSVILFIPEQRAILLKSDIAAGHTRGFNKWSTNAPMSQEAHSCAYLEPEVMLLGTRIDHVLLHVGALA